MDSGGDVIWKRRSKPSLECCEGWTDFESGIVAQRQATGDVRPKSPSAGLGPCPQHL